MLPDGPAANSLLHEPARLHRIRPLPGTMTSLEKSVRIARSVRCIVAAFSLVMAWHAASDAVARDNGQWEGSPPEVRRWSQGLRQPDNPAASCCGEANAYEADIFEVETDHYVAIITDGKGDIPNGTKIAIPNNKMKWDEGNPTGHGIIFIGLQGQVFCYVAPGGV
jgi:hypothetical protein